MDPHMEIKTVGLRISGSPEFCLEKFGLLSISNPYMYAHHSADDGVQCDHTHFCVIRDWNGTREAATMKFRRDVGMKGVLENKKGSCSLFALSLYNNTLLWNAQYLAHGDAAITYVGDEWARVQACNPKYQHIRNEQPDKDIETKQKEKDWIPLTIYNLVPTMQRYDRLHRVGKRTFKESYLDLLMHTRYRPNRDLITKGIPPQLVVEFESGVKKAAEESIDKMLRKGREEIPRYGF